MNYAEQIQAFLNGERAISTIARELIESAGQIGAEMDKLEMDIQHLFDESIIDENKIKSINAGLQRETGRFSMECTGIAVKVGIKLSEADSVSCYVVTAKRDTKKDELLQAVAEFKAAVKNGDTQLVCIKLASHVTRLMTSMVPASVEAA